MAPRTKSKSQSTTPLSIVGEAQRQLEDDFAVKWQSEEEVIEWVETVPDHWLICKERNRHRFVTLAERKRKGKLEFIGVEEFPGINLLIHAPLRCLDCKQVYSDERFAWEGRGKNAHLVRISRVTLPLPNATDGPDGVTYFSKPGSGRKSLKTIVNALANAGVKGMSQAEVMAAARAKQAEIKEAQRIADARAAAKQPKFSAVS